MKNTLKALFIPYGLGKLNYVSVWSLQFAIFLIIWSVYPAKDIPSLPEIATAWNQLASQSGLLIELWASIKTITISLAVSSIISLLFIYASTATIFRPASTAISALRFLGFAGITFLFTLWTSSATELKLWLLTFGMTVFLVTNMKAEVDAIPQSEIDYAKTLKMKGWRITWEVVTLGRAHIMLDLIRQNAAIGWTMLSMVEGITRSQGGVGALIINQNRTFNLAAIFAIQITILVYGLVQDALLGFIRNQMCPYATLVKAK